MPLTTTKNESSIQDILRYKFFEKLKELKFIDEIWLFGSRARGDNRTCSDLDLAIICDGATDKDWIKVTDIIEDADTLLKIDCIRFAKERINVRLHNNILKDKKVIYVKKHD